MKQLYFIISLCLLFCQIQTQAQELFVFAEPASTMATHMLSLRCRTGFAIQNQRLNTSYLPEIHYGISKNVMLQTEAYLSNIASNTLNGAGVYLQYKFLNHDKLYHHFRMAGFGKIAINNTTILYREINTQGANSGYNIGVIATQLQHKTAISSTLSYQQAMKPSASNNIAILPTSNALDYSLSIGRLLYPKKYIGYKQTNVNAMVEILGQKNLQNQFGFIDIAPSIQFILQSKARIDIAYKQKLFSNANRQNPSMFVIRVEYNFFNVFRNN